MLMKCVKCGGVIIGPRPIVNYNVSIFKLGIFQAGTCMILLNSLFKSEDIYIV